MKAADLLLQRWREARARPWIVEGADVLDVGCHEGSFLRSLGGRARRRVGMDPLAGPAAVASPGLEIIAERCDPPLSFPDGSFDAVTMLATFEHVPDDAQAPLIRELHRVLRPGGRVVLTVPSPRVDAIVDRLIRLGIADGMSLDEHHGFDPASTDRVFGAQGFRLLHRGRFQLGLNHLFVFEKR